MNTTESIFRFVTAAFVSVLLMILSCASVLAQDTEAQPTPESPLRITIETGLSISAWRVEYRSDIPDFGTTHIASTCPAAIGVNSRLGVVHPVGRRAELGGFVAHDLAAPSSCSPWENETHRMHAVTLGPAVVLRPLLAPRLFFRLGAGATWLSGKLLLANWAPRGVGASADVGYEVLHGRRATLFVSAGMFAGFGFDSHTYDNEDMTDQIEYGVEGRTLAGTLRIGATLH